MSFRNVSWFFYHWANTMLDHSYIFNITVVSSVITSTVKLALTQIWMCLCVFMCMCVFVFVVVGKVSEYFRLSFTKLFYIRLTIAQAINLSFSYFHFDLVRSLFINFHYLLILKIYFFLSTFVLLIQIKQLCSFQYLMPLFYLILFNVFVSRL